MSIYGLGAYWSGDDKTEDFIANDVACIGYGEEDAPSLYGLVSKIEIGDIIFIKSFAPNKGLDIKGVGVALENTISHQETLDAKGLKVKWKWTGVESLGKIDDHNSGRTMTLYEENNPQVRGTVIDLLFS